MTEPEQLKVLKALADLWYLDPETKEILKKFKPTFTFGLFGKRTSWELRDKPLSDKEGDELFYDVRYKDFKGDIKAKIIP